MSDFLLQKSPERGSLYHRPPGIWFSDELKRWMVTSPDLIRQVMYDDAFAVPNYDVSPVVERLGIDLGHLNEIRKSFPLAVEGEEHRVLRERFARHIARHTAAALDALSRELAASEAALLAKPAGEGFCLYAEVLRPALQKAICTLAGAGFLEGVPIESTPPLFDDAISPSRRRKINLIFRDLLEKLPPGWDRDQKHLCAAVIALGANTLLGSVSLSILERWRGTPEKPLSEIDWGSDLIRTALALVEKRAVRATMLGPVEISPGARLRLFIESDGVLPQDHYRYSDLFFAVGSHKCVGMSFSKQAWARFARFLSAIPRRMSVLEVRERSGDYVFNFPETIRVHFDD